MHNPAPSPATASPTDGDCSGHRRRHRNTATHGCTRPRTTHRQRLGTPHTCSLTRASEPVAGDCDFGRVVDGKLLTRPVWRMLTVSPHVAESIASALGAEPQRRLANGLEQFEVVAEKANLRVVIENADRLTGQMKLWDSPGLAHHCDGRAFLSPEADAGHPCGCPPTMAERRARARAGQGRSRSRHFCSTWLDALTSARSASGPPPGASPRGYNGYALNWPRWVTLRIANSRSKRSSSRPKMAAGSATTSPL